jgi:hypothetical protein
VAFEATYGWAWFADVLAHAGIEAHMAHPLATKVRDPRRPVRTRTSLRRISSRLNRQVLAILAVGERDRIPTGC